MLRSLTAKSGSVKAYKPLTNTTGSRFRGFVKNEQAEAIEAALDDVMGRNVAQYDSAFILYGEQRPERIEPPKVWTLPNKYWNIREKPTSQGERKPSELQKKWANDTQYQLYRETIGYNEFADTIPVGRVNQRYLQNIWSKNYFRDDQGEAVVPDRYVLHSLIIYFIFSIGWILFSRNYIFFHIQQIQGH